MRWKTRGMMWNIYVIRVIQVRSFSSGVEFILQFIEQILRIDAFELAILHQAQLAESVIHLG